jgi:mannosyltransferase OCH1-like enzyme
LAVVLRWIDDHGAASEAAREGLRTIVEPGQAAVIATNIRVPDRRGAMMLEASVVHAVAESSDGALRMPVSLANASAPPSRREERPPRRGLARFTRRTKLLIPKIIHRVWLGTEPMPEEHRAFGESWISHHPGWEFRFWTDADAPQPPGFERARNVAEKTDLVRYDIIRRHGGVYVDTDIECLRPIDDLLADTRAFAAYGIPGRLCNAVIGAVPGHPAFVRAVELAATTAGVGNYPSATATVFLTRVLEPFPDVTLFSPERFYPFLWDEERTKLPQSSSTYAVHHWAKSWLTATSSEAGRQQPLISPEP